MNPFNDLQWTRFSDAAYSHYQDLQPFVQKCDERVRRYVGKEYTGNLEGDKRPFNVGALAAITLAHRLMSNDPQFWFTTADDDLKESAVEIEATVNAWVKKIKAGMTLNRIVLNSLFGIGIAQVGVSASSDSTGTPGETNIWPIWVDAWVHDMSATRMEAAGYMGHVYDVPTASLLADPYISPEIKRNIKPSQRTQRTPTGDEKTSAITQGRAYLSEDWRDQTRIWQFWFREKNILVHALADEGQGMVGMPLKVAPWSGPRSGPYPILSHHDVPSNSLALAPSCLWSDLDVALNQTMNKIIRDCKRAKRIGLGQRGDESDIKTIREVANGEIALLSNPGAFTEMDIGGPNQVLLAAVVQMKNLFNYISGGIEQIAGLEVGAPTATQEKLLNESAQGTLKSMQARTQSFVLEVIRGGAGWLLSDPLLEMKAVKRIPDTDIDMPFIMTPDRVRGALDDYTLEIIPFSEVYLTPGERLQQALGLLERIFIPLSAQGAASGVALNVEAVLKSIIKMSRMPELEDWFTFAAPPATGPGTSAPGVGPTSTTRKYERSDRHNNGPAQQDAEMMAMLSSSANGQAA